MFSKALKSFSRTKSTSSFTALTRPSMAAFSSSESKYAPWNESKILVTGCQGQIGVPLIKALASELGPDQIIATDVSEQRFDLPCRYERLDVADESRYHTLVRENKVNYIVHLAGILSALGEQKPDLAIEVNVNGAVSAIRAANKYDCRLFIPSTIGAFGGDNFPKDNTPADVIL